jgi:hypothetical protein
MIAQFDAVKSADADSLDGDAAVVVSRFTSGSHGTPISVDSPAAFSELLTQTLMMFASDGEVAGSIVTNPDVLED